ncbi:unnamed protein product [Symbiodinium pilosum]|uniref:Uncharacterized protein n=1 Tax=Symbiodinium pilosum TaxID=2952 RepID=A0A812PP09_SYMPI|nr:unnamed protein product [Symbiodinium pilosum]
MMIAGVSTALAKKHRAAVGEHALYPKVTTLEVSGDILHAEKVKLCPHRGNLGHEGRVACPSQPRAAGVWRGSVEAQTPAAAAAKVVLLLPGRVALDACGSLADTALSCSSLHFLPSTLLEDDVRHRRAVAAQELGTAAGDDVACGCCDRSNLLPMNRRDVKVFVLAGQLGQVLSHHAELFLLARGQGHFEALLCLVPLAHSNRAARFAVARETPLGVLREVWQETAMVELPRLFQLSVRHGGTGLALPGKEAFLVQEDDELLVINAWHREEADSESQDLPKDSLTLEQLLWVETIRALADTTPCAEVPVPALRLKLSDEGVASAEDLLDGPENGGGVPPEEAPRLASLAFLRQYATRTVLQEELLPRLLPSGAGTFRVFSAELVTHEGGSPLKSLRPPKPRSLDDLFSDAPDFRKPSYFACGVDDENFPEGKEEDPLMRYDLTSVVLLCEVSGFVLGFHCLQAHDPCSV